MGGINGIIENGGNERKYARKKMASKSENEDNGIESAWRRKRNEKNHGSEIINGK
jgi:hypothetical protein